MGMPITVEIVEEQATPADLKTIFDYFTSVDERFSTYKNTSEITQINNKLLTPEQFSRDMQEVLKLSEETKQQTHGYFDIQKPDGSLDPSGLVKGWAIFRAAQSLAPKFQNFYIEAGGDIQTSGWNSQGEKWSIGIKNPFNQEQIVKVVHLSSQGIATSGTYIRGQHIYNSKRPKAEITDIISLSVIGPNVYEADRFATAAFAMGKQGIYFIEEQEGLEGYLIDKDGVGIETTGWKQFN